jgi:hypothetical protein
LSLSNAGGSHHDRQRPWNQAAAERLIKSRNSGGVPCNAHERQDFRMQKQELKTRVDKLTTAK